MIYAPIALFVYNRIDYLKRMMESLKKCTNAEKHEVYIFSDAPKQYKKGDSEKVNEVREYIKQIRDENFFAATNLIIADEHKGCANSIIYGIDYVFQKYDRVIDLEDDLILTEDALEYINSGLNFFESDDRIWSISAYTPPLKSLDSFNGTTFMGERASSWGFGIWKNRWDRVDWEMKWYEDFRNDKEKISSFAEWGYDLPLMLMEQAEGLIDAWDIITCYTQYLCNMYSVFPKRSKCFNIGCFGTHFNGCVIEQQSMGVSSDAYSFSECIYDQEISEERKNLFMTKDQFLNESIYSDAAKFKKYFEMSAKWIENRNQNIRIEDYLLDKGIKNIVIYGAGRLGNLFYEEINKSETINVICFIDKIKRSKELPKIVSPNEIQNIKKIDAIIITPIMDFREIKKELSNMIECRILSLWEVVMC